MTDALNVGLVGYGLAGRVFHAPLIHATADLHLHTVVERHADHSRERHPWVNIVRSLDDLLADPDIDLVVLATPNTLHVPQARQALAAGKHVVVDKPFTTTADEAQQLIDHAEENGVLVSVFQNRRWDGGFLTVRQILENGWLGQLAHYEATFDRFRNYLKEDAWREEPLPGSGLLYDLGSHLLDQAQVLFGWPQAITAVLQHQRPGSQTDDAFEVRLAYPTHTVTVQASMLAREPRPHFRLFGLNGNYVKYGLDPQEDALAAGKTPTAAGWGTEPEADWGTLNTAIDGLHVRGKVETLPGAYLTYYQNVAAAIRGEAALVVKPEEARNTIHLIELARKSHVEQRTLPCPPVT